MGTFDPQLMTQSISTFPKLKAGETIGGWSRITKIIDGKQYVCVVWSQENCKNCKETDCAFFKRIKES
jgi:hypothetical protein